MPRPKKIIESITETVVVPAIKNVVTPSPVIAKPTLVYYRELASDGTRTGSISSRLCESKEMAIVFAEKTGGKLA